MQVGQQAQAVVSGASPSTTVTIKLAGVTTTCVTSSSGLCVVSVKAKATLAKPTATYGSGKTKKSATSATYIAVPKLTLPKTVKHTKALAIKVSDALASSSVVATFTLNGGTPVVIPVTASSSGAATLFIPAQGQTGTATLTITDAGVTVASGSVTVS